MNSLKSTKHLSLFAIITAGFLAVLLSLSVFAPTAYAGGTPLDTIYKGTHKVGLQKGQGDTHNTIYYMTVDYKPIKNCKSSNKKIATVKVGKQKPEKYGDYVRPGYYYLKITFKKVGTVKISYTYKGKKHTATFKVKSYSNPMKSLKLGSAEYSSWFNADKVSLNSRVGMNVGIGYYAFLPTDKFQGKKLSITPASGWKIEKIYKENFTGKKIVKQNIKNKSKLKDISFMVDMKNTATGDVVSYSVQGTYVAN